MKIPKNSDVQLKTTENGTVELQITASITTKAQAAELIQCIRQVSGALESEKRGPRKSKVAAVA
jgi:hypothetical protein